MKPILWQWGQVIIPAWHLFFALGGMAAFIFLTMMRHRIPMQSYQTARLFLAGYLGGYVGARCLSIVIEPQTSQLWERLLEITRLGPMTFYGGLLGSALFAGLYTWHAKLPFSRVADYSFLAGFLGLGFGRIGCFLNGDDFGKPIPGSLLQGQDYPFWAVIFPALDDQLPRYPVQLWEAAFAFLMVIILASLDYRRPFRAGILALTSVNSYAIFRYCNEFFRGDLRGWVIDGLLSPSQLISLMILGSTAAFLILSPWPSQKDNKS